MAQALYNETAKGDDVRREEGSDAEGSDGVEGNSRADIDKR